MGPYAGHWLKQRARPGALMQCCRNVMSLCNYNANVPADSGELAGWAMKWQQPVITLTAVARIERSCEVSAQQVT